MAESLATIDDPIVASLPWPPTRDAAEVVGMLTVHAPPPPAAVVDAPWLREEQRPTVRRLVGVLRRHGGALLADPVGSGKTFIALAVAAILGEGSPVAAIVPAPLVAQWERRARECGIPLEILSHVAVSRGHLPSPDVRLILIDESHHFRDPGTHRYGYLAPFLTGKQVLCITATPTVNQIEDIAHQLLLGVRDDALRAAGTPSLRQALHSGDAPPALGELVIATPPSAALPERRERRTRWGAQGDPDAPSWLPELDALALSSRGPIAALVRCVLLSALSSSPAALRAALGRYIQLLRHGCDARQAGRPVDRSLIRRFTAEAPEQMLFWELMPCEVAPATLPLDDLDRAVQLRTRLDLTEPDPKAETLASLVSDGAPTLVFANAVATIPYLRDRLIALTPAWLTGSKAGWHHVAAPRDQVLGWFRPGAPEVAPWILLASDVAAEGLDLQRAARIVHYDLPWTAMRLAQREGRSRRLGGSHAAIEVVRLDPPAWLERRLRIGATLRRKSLLGRHAGLEGDASPWRWRYELAAQYGREGDRPGLAWVSGERAELLLGVQVEIEGRSSGGTSFALIDAHGEWSESPERIADAIDRATRNANTTPNPEDVVRWRSAIAPYIRTVLRRSSDRAWRTSVQSAEVRALLHRLQRMARRAARARDAESLDRLERMIAFVARGHTAGEARAIAELAPLSDETLLAKALGLPDTVAEGGVATVRIIGAVGFCPR